ncbi:hypothetical protein ACFL1B_04175 [Nanoarchaeota archaeon]
MPETKMRLSPAEGAVLNKNILASGMNQIEVAKAVGMDKGTLNANLQGAGKGYMTSEMAERLYDLLGRGSSIAFLVLPGREPSAAERWEEVKQVIDDKVYGTDHKRPNPDKDELVDRLQGIVKQY